MNRKKTDRLPIDDMTTIGYSVPLKVKDEFVDGCKTRGEVIQQSIAGAMKLWGFLPAEVREAARLSAAGKGDIDDAFWEDFGYGLRLGLASQLQSRHKSQK